MNEPATGLGAWIMPSRGGYSQQNWPCRGDARSDRVLSESGSSDPARPCPVLNRNCDELHLSPWKETAGKAGCWAMEKKGTGEWRSCRSGLIVRHCLARLVPNGKIRRALFAPLALSPSAPKRFPTQDPNENKPQIDPTGEGPALMGPTPNFRPKTLILILSSLNFRVRQTENPPKFCLIPRIFGFAGGGGGKKSKNFFYGPQGGR